MKKISIGKKCTPGGIATVFRQGNKKIDISKKVFE